MARRPNCGAHRPRLLGSLASPFAATILALLSLAGTRRGSFFQAGDGLHRVPEPAHREQVRAFLGRTMAKANSDPPASKTRAAKPWKTAPKYIICDRGKQLDCPGFRAWCTRGHQAATLRGDWKTRQPCRRGTCHLDDQTPARVLAAGAIPARSLFGELACTIDWYHKHHPHTWLNGRTPDGVYYGKFPANRKPRFEPRACWPRRSPCARPWALVRGSPGARLTVEVSFHKGKRHLPIVTIKLRGVSEAGVHAHGTDRARRWFASLITFQRTTRLIAACHKTLSETTSCHATFATILRERSLLPDGYQFPLDGNTHGRTRVPISSSGGDMGVGKLASRTLLLVSIVGLSAGLSRAAEPIRTEYDLLRTIPRPIIETMIPQQTGTIIFGRGGCRYLLAAVVTGDEARADDAWKSIEATFAQRVEDGGLRGGGEPSWRSERTILNKFRPAAEEEVIVTYTKRKKATGPAA